MGNSSAAEAEKARCSWCPKPCSTLHMFSCAGARRVWGSHDLLRVGERRGVLFCAELFFENMSWAHNAGGRRGVPGKLTLFFRLRERAARATGRGRRRGPGCAPPEPKEVGRGERRRGRGDGAAAKTPCRSKQTRFYLGIYYFKGDRGVNIVKGGADILKGGVKEFVGYKPV